MEPNEPVGFIVLGRKENDRNICKLPRPAADFKAIDSGHHDVKDHDIGMIFLEALEGFPPPIAGQIDSKLLVLEIGKKDAEKLLIIISNEYGICRHRATSFSACNDSIGWKKKMTLPS